MPQQLDLSFYGPRSLRGAIADYIAHNTADLAEGTLADYHERALWLRRQFGELTPIDRITYDVLFACVRRNHELLANVTIKKRFQLLRWVLEFAHGRDLVARVPMFPKLKDDSRPGSNLHTVGEWEVFRRYVPPGPFRRLYDLGFWTLHHATDVFTMERWMLDADRTVTDERGKEIGRGAFWRRNTKNNNPKTGKRKCEPCWIPMQPDLRLLVPELLEGLPERRDARIVGRLWNLQRTLNMAYTRAVGDGHEIPRITPRDLRRSGASMLSGRGYLEEAVRLTLGHTGAFRKPAPGEALHRLAGPTTTATAHYLRPTPGVFIPTG